MLYSKLKSICVFVIGAFAFGVIPVFAFPAVEIDSASTNFISLTQDQPYNSTIAIAGENFNYLIFNENVTVHLGPFVANSVTGNANSVNVTFGLDTAFIDTRKNSFPIIVKENGEEVYRTDFEIEVADFYSGIYKRTNPRRYLDRTKRNGPGNKRQVGLNVHMALGSDANLDSTYLQRLDESNTKWVREHISYELVMGDNQAAWLTRYDKIMLRYKEQDIRVVAMLAYGDGADEFVPPSKEDWREFVELISTRYKNYIDAYEIWNEPDSPDYMHPNTWEAYKPILIQGSKAIRKNDPDAIVLNGAVSNITDLTFTKKLYSKGRRYFDELNVHLYYCGQYRDQGERLRQLRQDWKKYYKFIQSKQPGEKVWVTELGCTTGLPGINNAMVRNYNKDASNYLRKFSYMRPVFIYTFRDRPFLSDQYEANFGIFRDDLTPKASYNWYSKLPLEL